MEGKGAYNTAALRARRRAAVESIPPYSSTDNVVMVRQLGVQWMRDEL